MQYDKSKSVKLSANFSSDEFKCPCTNCTSIIIDTELVKKLQEIRDYFKTRLTVTSGYRCSQYQLELKLRGYETSTGPSTHEQGKAADIMCEGKTGKEIEQAAEKAGFEAIGVGHSFCHVDLRQGKHRRWVYSKR